MPKLGNLEEIERIILPSTKDLPPEQQAWVDMDVSPRKAGDFYYAQSLTGGQIVFAVFLARLKDWNYVDDNGEKLPITTDTIGRLNTEDFTFLQTKIVDGGERKLDVEEKKVSSDTSSQAVSVPVVSQ